MNPKSQIYIKRSILPFSPHMYRPEPKWSLVNITGRYPAEHGEAFMRQVRRMLQSCGLLAMDQIADLLRKEFSEIDAFAVERVLSDLMRAKEVHRELETKADQFIYELVERLGKRSEWRPEIPK